MTTHISTAARPDVPGAIIEAARRLLQALKSRFLARRTVSMLHDLTDHQLKDIGLRRAEIDGRFGT